MTKSKDLIIHLE